MIPVSHTHRLNQTRCELARGKRTRRRLKVEVGREESASVEIIRRKRKITLGAASQDNAKEKAHGSVPEKPARTLAGAFISDLDIFTRRELMVPNHIEGVLVHLVAQDSPAQKAGLRSRDIITEIHCSRVINASHALTAAEVWKDGRVLLQVWNEKGFRHLVIHKE